MEKLAIIGTGIAGMGCGHFLHKKYDTTFFEQNDYIDTLDLKVISKKKTLPDIKYTIPLSTLSKLNARHRILSL